MCFLLWLSRLLGLILCYCLNYINKPFFDHVKWIRVIQFPWYVFLVPLLLQDRIYRNYQRYVPALFVNIRLERCRGVFLSESRVASFFSNTLKIFTICSLCTSDKQNVRYVEAIATDNLGDAGQPWNYLHLRQDYTI